MGALKLHRTRYEAWAFLPRTSDLDSRKVSSRPGSFRWNRRSVGLAQRSIRELLHQHLPRLNPHWWLRLRLHYRFGRGRIPVLSRAPVLGRAPTLSLTPPVRPRSPPHHHPRVHHSRVTSRSGR